ncbi:MAG TPA: hypothetical protein VI387_02420 [Candidatus Brocadiales bacterium]|nr:hypothetical protein [Candidatus Brocadiales bacterium]
MKLHLKEKFIIDKQGEKTAVILDINDYEILKQMTSIRKDKELQPLTDKDIKKLLSLIGICKTGKKDLAEKHDYYLYGKGKK